METTMKKYKGKYRTDSMRAQWWDYGWKGAYFITICTKNRRHFFGEIKNGKMECSNVGTIVDVLWHEIPHHSPFTELGEFVVMPNHLHGILILSKPQNKGNGNNDGRSDVVETLHATSLPRPQQPPDHPPPSEKNKQMSDLSPKSGTVSRIIGSYKSAITKHANRLQFPHEWQPGFYDHIIRDEPSYQRIATYIKNNPGNWKDDKFYNG